MELPLTHGFHSYPARLSPALVGHLLDVFGAPGLKLVDPFCGSGTTLVEAMVRGIDGYGVDLNPIALRVATTQSRWTSHDKRQRFASYVEQTTEGSLQYVRQRVYHRAPLAAAQRALYPPHVLRELAGLWHQIGTCKDRRDRPHLEVVFSAIAMKFSRRSADTSAELGEPLVRKGLPSEFFRRKGFELVRRWESLAEACVATRGRPSIPARGPSLKLADARVLPTLWPKLQAHLVVSSPPYGGVYDYTAHHRLRLAWLGLSQQDLTRLEIGARRHAQSRDAAQQFAAAMRSSLRACATVLARRRFAFLVIGDAFYNERRLDGRALVRALAPQSSLRFVASSSDRRLAVTRRGREHWEHLVMLQRR